MKIIEIIENISTLFFSFGRILSYCTFRKHSYENTEIVEKYKIEIRIHL